MTAFPRNCFTSGPTRFSFSLEFENASSDNVREVSLKMSRIKLLTREFLAELNHDPDASKLMAKVQTLEP